MTMMIMILLVPLDVVLLLSLHTWHCRVATCVLHSTIKTPQNLMHNHTGKQQRIHKRVCARCMSMRASHTQTHMCARTITHQCTH